MLKPAYFHKKLQGKKLTLSNHPNSEAAKIHRLNLAYEKFQKRIDELLAKANQITADFLRKVDQEKYKRTLTGLQGA